MDGTSKVDRQSSPDSDLYAALMLSNLLDSEQDVQEKQRQQEQEIEKEKEQTIDTSTAKEEQEEEPELNHDVIWVPADKHPQIAPNEFANFIKTHGANTPSRKSSSLRRRKSILSQSLSVKSNRLPENQGIVEEEDEDEDDLNRTLSEKKRQFLKKVMNDSEKLKSINTNNAGTFDRNSSSIDDSRIIVPKRTDKSLSRRSAFSARGRNRKEDRQQQAKRSLSTRAASENNKIIWDKSDGKGISLYDQPVNMSEWIDLGSASLIVDSKSNEDSAAQRGILSRVHDAESQLQLQQQQQRQQQQQEEAVKIKQDDVKEETKEEEVDMLMLSELPPLTLQLSLPITKEKEVEEKEEAEKTTAAKNLEQQDGPKRPSIVRSTTENIKIPTVAPPVSNQQKKPAKPEKRTSWLGGLFSGNNNNSNNSTSNSALSGLTTLFTRSLSMKSSNNTLTFNNLSNTTTTTNNNTTNNKNSKVKTKTTAQQNNKKRSSRLETTPTALPLPPSFDEKCFSINSNRLPLHVERSIYRLSHYKLADPKRPLKQQVLISNLMFWYLSIQQNDFNQVQPVQITHNMMEEAMPPPQKEQQQPKNKMSRLIHSAKKRKNEVAQFVSSSYPDATASSTTSKKNVQFSLAPIPSHHLNINTDEKEIEEEEEEDENIPLSHYKVNSIQK